ncbi:hypothetical protein ACE6H2_007219 [Prunus campanulata]
MEQSRGLRLILLPLPLQGHINPMLELGNLLHSKGFSITIVQTKFNSLNPSSHPHFIFHSIPVDLSESEASIKDATRLFSLTNAKCVEPFRECLATLLSDAEQDPVAYLISDPHLHFTRSVAESFSAVEIVPPPMNGSKSAIAWNSSQ